MLHLSFREFLLDQEKRGISVFWVDERKTNNVLANRCLELLSGRLQENICSLESPGTLRTEISTQTIEKCLPADVRYACRHWVQHWELSGEYVCDEDAVHTFLKKHFLHWLEALSLVGKLSDSIAQINTLRSLVDVSYLALIPQLSTYVYLTE